jgi:hypothetical protein
VAVALFKPSEEFLFNFDAALSQAMLHYCFCQEISCTLCTSSYQIAVTVGICKVCVGVSTQDGSKLLLTLPLIFS